MVADFHRWLRSKINAAGFNLKATGTNDPQLSSAISSMQKALGLKVTGTATSEFVDAIRTFQPANLSLTGSLGSTEQASPITGQMQLTQSLPHPVSQVPPQQPSSQIPPSNPLDWLLNNNRRAVNNISGAFGGPQLGSDSVSGGPMPQGAPVPPQMMAGPPPPSPGGMPNESYAPMSQPMPGMTAVAQSVGQPGGFQPDMGEAGYGSGPPPTLPPLTPQAQALIARMPPSGQAAVQRGQDQESARIQAGRDALVQAMAARNMPRGPWAQPGGSVQVVTPAMRQVADALLAAKTAKLP